MNPNEKIAPIMDTNEAARRLLAIFVDSNSNLKPGVPGGPLAGKALTITRVVARGPLPTLAVMLVPARANRAGAYIVNLDDTQTVWYSDNPNVTDQTGGTLEPKQSLPINFSGPIYVYTLAAAPIIECVEALSS